MLHQNVVLQYLSPSKLIVCLESGIIPEGKQLKTTIALKRN